MCWPRCPGPWQLKTRPERHRLRGGLFSGPPSTRESLFQDPGAIFGPLFPPLPTSLTPRTWDSRWGPPTLAAPATSPGKSFRAPGQGRGGSRGSTGVPPCPPPRRLQPPQTRPMLPPQGLLPLGFSRQNLPAAPQTPLQRRTASISLPAGPQNYHKTGEGGRNKHGFCTDLANGSTSNTNFSILIPFGWSGFTGCPCSSTQGTFFTATCGCSRGSSSLGTRGQQEVRHSSDGHLGGPSLPPARLAGWGNWTDGHNGHRAVRAQLSPVSAEPESQPPSASPLTKHSGSGKPRGGWRPPAQPLYRRAHSAAPAAELSGASSLFKLKSHSALQPTGGQVCPQALQPGWRGSRLLRTPGDGPEEVSGEEVVADVACVVQQAPTWRAQARHLGADLAVLHHLGDAVHLAHHAHWLLRVRLLHHLQPRQDG